MYHGFPYKLHYLSLYDTFGKQNCSDGWRKVIFPDFSTEWETDYKSSTSLPIFYVIVYKAKKNLSLFDNYIFCILFMQLTLYILKMKLDGNVTVERLYLNMNKVVYFRK